MKPSPLRGPGLATVALTATSLLAVFTDVSAAKSGKGYKYYVTGNPADVQKPTRGLWVAQGGGDDVDANYARMGEYGGGGDFVVLRASGEEEYNKYIFSLCRCDSVETLVFDKGTGTSDPFVIENGTRVTPVPEYPPPGLMTSAWSPSGRPDTRNEPLPVAFAVTSNSAVFPARAGAA